MTVTLGEAAAGVFADIARRLAGIAGWYLGWTADQFWHATPAEMEGIMRVMMGVEDGETAGVVPPSRDVIARLQEIFPDG